MTILSIQTESVGQAGQIPKLVYIDTNNTVAEVSEAGFLNQSAVAGYGINGTAMAVVTTKESSSSQDATNIYTISLNSIGVITLTPVTGGGGGDAWTLTGNLDAPSDNYLGTKDAVDLTIGTDGVDVILISSNQDIAIGNASTIAINAGSDLVLASSATITIDAATELLVPSLSSSSTANVLYYNTVNGQITQGAAPGSGGEWLLSGENSGGGLKLGTNSSDGWEAVIDSVTYLALSTSSLDITAPLINVTSEGKLSLVSTSAGVEINCVTGGFFCTGNQVGIDVTAGSTADFRLGATNATAIIIGSAAATTTLNGTHLRIDSLQNTETSSVIYYNAGTSNVTYGALPTASADWQLAGNESIPGGSFLGTLDASQPLLFKTNNVTFLAVTAAQEVAYTPSSFSVTSPTVDIAATTGDLNHISSAGQIVLSAFTNFTVTANTFSITATGEAGCSLDAPYLQLGGTATEITIGQNGSTTEIVGPSVQISGLFQATAGNVLYYNPSNGLLTYDVAGTPTDSWNLMGTNSGGALVLGTSTTDGFALQVNDTAIIRLSTTALNMASPDIQLNVVGGSKTVTIGANVSGNVVSIQSLQTYFPNLQSTPGYTPVTPMQMMIDVGSSNIAYLTAPSSGGSGWLTTGDNVGSGLLLGTATTAGFTIQQNGVPFITLATDILTIATDTTITSVHMGSASCPDFEILSAGLQINTTTTGLITEIGGPGNSTAIDGTDLTLPNIAAGAADSLLFLNSGTAKVSYSSVSGFISGLWQTAGNSGLVGGVLGTTDAQQWDILYNGSSYISLLSAGLILTAPLLTLEATASNITIAASSGQMILISAHINMNISPSADVTTIGNVFSGNNTVLNSASIRMPNLPNNVESSVVFFNSSTGALSYGEATVGADWSLAGNSGPGYKLGTTSSHSWQMICNDFAFFTVDSSTNINMGVNSFTVDGLNVGSAMTLTIGQDTGSTININVGVTTPSSVSMSGSQLGMQGASIFLATDITSAFNIGNTACAIVLTADTWDLNTQGTLHLGGGAATDLESGASVTLSAPAVDINTIAATNTTTIGNVVVANDIVLNSIAISMPNIPESVEATVVFINTATGLLSYGAGTVAADWHLAGNVGSGFKLGTLTNNSWEMIANDTTFLAISAAADLTFTCNDYSITAAGTLNMGSTGDTNLDSGGILGFSASTININVAPVTNVLHIGNPANGNILYIDTADLQTTTPLSITSSASVQWQVTGVLELVTSGLMAIQSVSNNISLIAAGNTVSFDADVVAATGSSTVTLQAPRLNINNDTAILETYIGNNTTDNIVYFNTPNLQFPNGVLMDCASSFEVNATQVGFTSTDAATGMGFVSAGFFTLSVATASTWAFGDTFFCSATNSYTIGSTSDVVNITGATGVEVRSTTGQLIIDATNNQLVIPHLGYNGFPTSNNHYLIWNQTNGLVEFGFEVSGAYSYIQVTSTTQAVVKNVGYITANVALITFTLPVGPAIGDVFEIVGSSAGGWALNQNSSQFIYFGNQQTSVGTGGNLVSTNPNDSVKMVCTQANIFTVISSVGSITVT